MPDDLTVSYVCVCVCVCVSVCVCDGPTRDVIGVAKTGSGKTLAFLLPMFRHIQVHTYVLTCRERFFQWIAVLL